MSSSRNPNLLVLSALALSACAPAVRSGSGSDGDKVAGGAVETRFPAVGAIVMDGDPGCTATVFACGQWGERRVGYAVTAAHCFEDDAESLYLGISPNGDSVAWGQVKSWIADGPATFEGGVLPVPDDSPVKLFQIEATANHPNYDADLAVYRRDNTEMHPFDDIAMMRLTACPMDVLPNLQPIPLEESAEATAAGTPLVLAGWGLTAARRESAPPELRSVALTVTRRYPTTLGYRAVPSHTSRGRPMMVCNGDSGGPALVGDDSSGFRVAGVTSWGDSECKHYGISTSVASYAPFVRAFMAGETFAPDVTDPCRDKVNSELLTQPRESEDEDGNDENVLEEPSEDEEEESPPCAYMNGACEPGCEIDTPDRDGDPDCFHEPGECRPERLVEEPAPEEQRE